MHGQIEVVFSLCDNLMCRFEDRTLSIPKYGFVVLDARVLHHIFATNEEGPFDRYVVYFDADYISSYSNADINLLRCFLKCSLNHQHILKIDEKYIPTILNQLKMMERCKMRDCVFDTNESYCLLHEKYLLCEFLLMLNRLYDMAYGQEGFELFDAHSKTVFKICDYVKSHISESLSIEAVADRFGISKTQLFYIFKKATSVSLGRYISDYRITLAKDLILNSNKTIDEISCLLGYSSVSAFSRSFKTSTDFSPLQYRKEAQLHNL